MGSKKAHIFVAVALLMALLAAVVSAGRGDLPMAENQCTRVGGCTDAFCTESCSKHDVGTCKTVGLFVYCCCGPVHATSIDARPHGH
ncbi:hypothetical protein QOZ80_7BG0597880 [Eleusine coracana subsp. coracana]|nr:hypothetical protein QOZ80_7BG0597880 [Eleusine coracana subsp. coracana]